jgi:Zn finger protein HypA/HybF involved in hydrogenase expression
MHEMGVAMEIVRIAEQKVGVADAQLVTRLDVVLGDDAGIDPSSLEFCLEALLAQPPFAGAVPNIIRERGDVLRLDSLEIDDERPRH